jgi:hypothetical protein
MFTEPHRQRSACFAYVASATFTGNAIYTMCRLLCISFLPNFYKRSPKSLFCSEDGPDVVTIPYTLKLLSHTFPHMEYIQSAQDFLCFWTTAAVGVNEQVNETMGRALKLLLSKEGD